MLAIIKCEIRNQQSTLYDFQEGNLSFGKMAESLAASILKRCEEKGMLPPIAKIPSFNTYDNYWEPE